jgi:hypothetical protein
MSHIMQKIAQLLTLKQEILELFKTKECKVQYVRKCSFSCRKTTALYALALKLMKESEKHICCIDQPLFCFL